MEHVVNILESFLGPYRKHNEESGQISFDCPACSEDNGMPEGDGKGNLEINYYKDVFKCWACKDINDMFGGVTKLIKKYGNLKLLAEYRIIQPEKQQEGKGEILRILELPESFKFLKDCSSKDFKYNRAMWYLTDRGLTNDIINSYNIGYTTSGKYHNRIIIPSYNVDGVLNYYVARWFEKHHNPYKYLNPDASKQDIIFNEYRINWDATIYLLEGAFDHIVVPNSIPLLGKDISDVLFIALHEKANANIVIVFDPDAYKDAKALYLKLNVGKLIGRIRACKFPDGYDPSKTFEVWGAKGIIHYLKNANKIKEKIL